jgi:hypothetical protein
MDDQNPCESPQHQSKDQRPSSPPPGALSHRRILLALAIVAAIAVAIGLIDLAIFKLLLAE